MTYSLEPVAARPISSDMSVYPPAIISIKMTKVFVAISGTERERGKY